MQKKKTCSNCGTEFTCGTAVPSESCWCTELPNIMPLDFSKDCYCRECLSRIIQNKIEKKSGAK